MADSPLSNIARGPAVERLKEEAQSYLMAQAERMLVGVGHKLGDATVKLNDIADGKSPGFGKLALQAGKKVSEGKGPVRSALEIGGGHLKDKVTDAVKGIGGGKRKKGGAGQKPTVILEYVDVGVPIREAYDQWTQYQEFSTFAKGVKGATVASDTDTDWKLKVFWSSRSWKAHTTEQVPDQRITWTSEGAKGTTKGVVTFHSLAENLTRVLLVIEYYPKGLFEKTGNIWRAQGRRARLDLKNFARHISIRGEASDGWRGEIRDGEVVRSHEDAVAEEEREENENESESANESENDPQSEYDEDREQDQDEDQGEDHGADADAEYEDEPDAEYEDEPEDDEPEAEYEDEDGADEDGVEDEAEGEYEDERPDERADDRSDEPEAEYEDEPEDDEPEAEYEDDEEADAEEDKRREYAESSGGGRSRR
ncbi:cyclase [Streptomyces alfalfae]|uniref:SRPBCC family protein n=1 Tax=Streptomyces alfalfae TaxID=1642299 RepID=UPI0009A1C9F1|nr:SRPBCC family protein [Streptomyces alfalfae]AYA15705.1 cyclase [Streptomyces fradiae]QUI34834.1 SRPBCC family protein [Streptomyces alfalfae]RXX39182.1 cyclase [Streptomyces alfalfae]RZM99298.1 cyclase [Streptomyces alfalfae]